MNRVVGGEQDHIAQKLFRFTLMKPKCRCFGIGRDIALSGFDIIYSALLFQKGTLLYTFFPKQFMWPYVSETTVWIGSVKCTLCHTPQGKHHQMLTVSMGKKINMFLVGTGYEIRTLVKICIFHIRTSSGSEAPTKSSWCHSEPFPWH